MKLTILLIWVFRLILDVTELPRPRHLPYTMSRVLYMLVMLIFLSWSVVRPIAHIFLKLTVTSGALLLLSKLSKANKDCWLIQIATCLLKSRKVEKYFGTRLHHSFQFTVASGFPALSRISVTALWHIHEIIHLSRKDIAEFWNRYKQPVLYCFQSYS